MANMKRERKLEPVILDAVEFRGRMQEYHQSIQEVLIDLSLALGQAVGHAKLVAGVRQRVNDTMYTPRTELARTLFDGVLQAIELRDESPAGR